MLDPGALTLVGALLLAPAPVVDPPAPLHPLPAPGEACVLPAYYLGGRLEPCAEPRTQLAPALPPVVPLERPGHSASDE